MKNISGFEFVKEFESEIPLWLAEDKDPVGLHIGDLSQTVKKIMVTLDVRPEVVEEAIEKGVDFIVAHHPPIYRAIERLDLSDQQNKMYAALIKHDIRVYAAHTNLDQASDGINDWLAEALRLEDTEIMDVTRTIPLKRLNVYVPDSHVEQVRDAITSAGAGNISENYTDCSYQVKGVGRFTPVGSAHPTIGKVGTAEEVAETRVEVILQEKDTQAIVDALFQAHPYEEPVYELYPIEKNQELAFGLGRVGNLKEEMSLKKFVHYTKDVFNVKGLRLVTPDPDKMVKRVAICGGDAGKYYKKAIQKKADVYITGDVYYHTAHDMLSDGLTVLDPGHHIEKICIPKLTEKLLKWRDLYEWDIEVIPSEINTNPFLFDQEL